MAYNNLFPANYQALYYPQPMQTPVNPTIQPQIQPQTQQANNSSRIWVQGETGAKSYLVAPNTSVDLWDSERQSIYIKTADASGMPSIRILDYKIRDNVPSSVPDVSQTVAPGPEPEYATKKDIEHLKERIEELKTKIETPTKPAGRKKAADDDE